MFITRLVLIKNIAHHNENDGITVLNETCDIKTIDNLMDVINVKKVVN